MKKKLDKAGVFHRVRKAAGKAYCGCCSVGMLFCTWQIRKRGRPRKNFCFCEGVFCIAKPTTSAGGYD